jgi:hypothetical protein
MSRRPSEEPLLKLPEESRSEEARNAQENDTPGCCVKVNKCFKVFLNTLEKSVGALIDIFR